MTGRLLCSTVLKMELSMSQAQITLDSASVAMLDATAAASAFSREEALKEAIEQYCAYDQWFRARVEEGLAALAAGDVVSNEQVEQECLAVLASVSDTRFGNDQ